MSRATDDRSGTGDTQWETGGSATSGQFLRHYRQLAHLTQEELAERSGYSANYISKLERDQRQPPPAAVDRLAEVLGLDGAQREALRTSRSQNGRPLRGSDGAPLVGRHAELTAIDRYLTAGDLPVLVFAGEPGIGKTRLLDEAAVLAAKNGWQVVRGDCPPWEQDPYSPLTDALARSIRALPERARAAALEDTPSLTLLLPELVNVSPAGTSWREGSGDRVADFQGPEGERRVLFSAVSAYFRRVAGPAGTLLVLDDLQWAGDDALRLLATLVTSAQHPAIRLIAAYRDSEVAVGSPLRGLMADLARTSRIRVVSLDPLSASETAQLLEELVPDDDESGRALLPAIARRAGGVPFFLVSYAEDLRLREGESAPTLDLPWTVAEVIRQRVMALPKQAREVLDIAAIIGRVVPRSLVTQIAGMEEEQVLGGLEAAAAARLLEEDGENAYRFVHDVIRENVATDLSTGRQQLLHRRIGEVLEAEQRPDIDALAHHFVRSNDGDKAIKYLELAGDDAQRRFAHAAAIGFYREALIRLDQLDRTLEATPIRERLGVALFLSARYDEAIDALEQAAAVYQETGDEEGVRRISGRIAEATFRRGGEHHTIEQVAALADETEAQEQTSPGSLRLRQGLFRLLLARGAYKQMLSGGRALARLGSATHNSRMEAMGRATQGVALISLGQLHQGAPMLDEAVPKLLAAGQRNEVADTSLLLSAVHLAMGSLPRCRELGEQMLPVAQSLNDPVIIGCHSGILGMTLYSLGDWESGRALVRQADELLATVKPSSLAIRTTVFRVTPLIWEGDWETARHTLKAAIHFARATDDVPSHHQALSALAEVDLLEGDPQTAVATLAPLADSDLGWGYAVSLLSTLAWAYLETGEPARAEQLAQQAVAQAETMGTWFHGVSALRIQGMIATRLNRFDAADTAYGEGLRRARAMPFPYCEAQTQYEWGRMLAAAGKPTQARKRLVEALIIFQKLGARPYVERTEQALQLLAHTG